MDQQSHSLFHMTTALILPKVPTTQEGVGLWVTNCTVNPYLHLIPVGWGFSRLLTACA